MLLIGVAACLYRIGFLDSMDGIICMLLVDTLGVIAIMLLKQKLIRLARFVYQEYRFFVEVRWYGTSLMFLLHSVCLLLIACVISLDHPMYYPLFGVAIAALVLSCLLTPSQLRGCLQRLLRWLYS